MFLAKRVLKLLSKEVLLIVLLLFTAVCRTNVHETKEEESTAVANDTAVDAGEPEAKKNDSVIATNMEKSTEKDAAIVQIDSKNAVPVDTVVDGKQDVAAISLVVDKPLVGAGAATANTDAYKNLTDHEKVLTLTNTLLGDTLVTVKKNGPKWLRNTDVHFSFDKDYKPVYSTEMMQPLGNVNKKRQMWFWQGRYDHSGEEKKTANLGFGWRKLSADKTHIIGLNTFYDYGFQYDLARIGVGAEFFSKIAEYRVNWYCPVSGVKEVDSTSGLFSGAMDGVDVERGYKVLSKIKLTPRVNVEVGYQNLNMNRGAYGRLTYQLGNVAGAALGGVAQTPNRMEFDLTSHFTQKVERENGVTTEMKPASSS